MMQEGQKERTKMVDTKELFNLKVVVIMLFKPGEKSNKPQMKKQFKTGLLKEKKGGKWAELEENLVIQKKNRC